MGGGMGISLLGILGTGTMIAKIIFDIENIEYSVRWDIVSVRV